MAQQRSFGIDFGTTNSLVATINEDRAYAFADGGRPHPSVIWYRGSEVVVGRTAREHLDSGDGTPPAGLLRSPKTSLREGGAIHLDGRRLSPVEVVADVLRYLRDDAASHARGRTRASVDRAVFAVPVAFEGRHRRELREAARIAGIGVVQFVHEPAAALYAYLRGRPDSQRTLAELAGQSVLVVDWGGGTLDLTICRFVGGTLLQVASLGDSTVGGDEFDKLLRNLVRTRHADRHGLDDLLTCEQPGMAGKLLAQCEQAKIALSDPARSERHVAVRNYLRGAEGRDLREIMTRDDVAGATRNLVDNGLGLIDRLLDEARLTRMDIALCLPAGGTVNVPAVRAGLTERFGGRVAGIANGDRIIAEGAAWIAHDGLRPALAKPIEVHVADGTLSGHYHTLVPAGIALPVENESKAVAHREFRCADPRDGQAVFNLAKPVFVGSAQPQAPRETLATIQVPVNPNTRPLFERLTLQINLDHDCIAHVRARSDGRQAEASAEIHRLDFALPIGGPADDAAVPPPAGHDSLPGGERAPGAGAPGQVAIRSNVAPADAPHARAAVPGDLAYRYWPGEMTQRQRDEYLYYQPCASCGRTVFALQSEGLVAQCHQRGCSPDANANRNWGA